MNIYAPINTPLELCQSIIKSYEAGKTSAIRAMAFIDHHEFDYFYDEITGELSLNFEGEKK